MDSPGNREVGRLRTCEVREIGRLEDPGSGRSSGLPPRILFLPPIPKQMGSESAQVLKSYYDPTLLVLRGRNCVAGAPFPAVFRFQRRFPPGNFRRFLRPPSTAGSAATISGRCGGREIGRSGKGQRGERQRKTREEDDRGQRKKENRRRRQQLHMTDVRAAGGRIPGEPGNW